MVAAEQPAGAEPRLGHFPFLEDLSIWQHWEYLPLDQGGRLVHLEIAGDELDATCVKLLRQPELPSAWGSPGPWTALEKKQVERSVWLNRWYLLPAAAREARRRGDRALFGEVFAFIRRWSLENSLPSGEARRATYYWRDMQVAWRTQNLAWVYFLGVDDFNVAEREFLYNCLAQHAQVLFAELKEQSLGTGNHQSHAAVALWYAAFLFPDLPAAREMISLGQRILEHHLVHAFFADGNSIELVPGYYPFFVSNFRDAWRLAQGNGHPLPAVWETTLRRFHAFLGQVHQPDGTMPPINDSSETPALPTLTILGRVLGNVSAPMPVCTHFPDSHQGVLRDNLQYALVDAGPTITWHWHGGKCGVHYWAHGEPVLVDSGVSNYDDPRRTSWFTEPQAHNTLLVDGHGDRERARIDYRGKPEAGSQILAWEEDELACRVLMEHRGFADLTGSVTWRRHVILVRGAFTLIADEINSNAVHDYRLPFHFASGPLETYAEGEGRIFRGSKCAVYFAPFNSPGASPALETQGWVQCGSVSLEAPVLTFQARASTWCPAFILCPLHPQTPSQVPILHSERVDEHHRLVVSCGHRRYALDIPHQIAAPARVQALP